MSMSKVDREFYSLISVLLKDETLFTDRYYEALDELKHVWRSYYETVSYTHLTLPTNREV